VERNVREMSTMENSRRSRSKSLILALVGLLIVAAVLVIISVYPQFIAVPVDNVTLYAYGDSNTVANYPADLMKSDGSDSYAIQYCTECNANCNCSHNMDGGGMTSQWGLENIKSHYAEQYDYFIIAFGVNDIRDGIPPGETAQNLSQMAAYVQRKGSTPIVLVPPLVPPDWKPYDTQRHFIQTLEDELTAHNQTFVRGYDAVDTVPFNNQMDEYDPQYYNPDGVHLNRAGHLKVAQLLHEKIDAVQ
jgi:lysophospholipase L1-like esterase